MARKEKQNVLIACTNKEKEKEFKLMTVVNRTFHNVDNFMKNTLKELKLFVQIDYPY